MRDPRRRFRSSVSERSRTLSALGGSDAGPKTPDLGRVVGYPWPAAGNAAPIDAVSRVRTGDTREIVRIPAELGLVTRDLDFLLSPIREVFPWGG